MNLRSFLRFKIAFWNEFFILQVQNKDVSYPTELERQDRMVILER